jgi:hypothetical protein
MIEVLFQPEDRMSAVQAILEASDPISHDHYDALADTINRLLLANVDRYIDRLLDSGRGCTANEFDSAHKLRNNAENIIRRLRLSSDRPLSFFEAKEMADSLNLDWLTFAAEASAYRMYHDLLRADRAQALGNATRKDKADRDLLATFSAWQSRRRKTLTENGMPLPAEERVRRFKRAIHFFPNDKLAERRQTTEREYRRLRALLKAGRIPAL